MMATEGEGSLTQQKKMESQAEEHDSVDAIMAKGRRHFLCKEFTEACECFELASSSLASAYGQLSDECGDAYFYYGKSLLEVARLEEGVLGSNLVNGGKEESSDDEEQENVVSQNGDASEKQPSENKIETENAAEENDKGEEEEGTEDVSSMQLAWEMIELSKAIAARSSEKQQRTRQSDCLCLLGEISLELENYDAAVEDFTSCLELRKDMLPADDRLIAEIHYNLGLSHMFCKDFEQALDNFKSSLDCINLRTANLEASIGKIENNYSGKQKADPESQIEVLRTEAKDLSSLVPDIMAKIEDAAEMKKDNESAMATFKDMAKQFFGQTQQTAAEKSNPFDAPSTSLFSGVKDDTKVAVSDINHLVRKKRKPEVDAPEQTVSQKTKLESDEGVAGCET